MIWRSPGGRTDPAEITKVSRARDKSSITRCSTIATNPHLLSLSIDNPAPPHHRIRCDIEQPFKCLTGIDIGSMFFRLGLACFGDRRRVGILSFLGVEQIRCLLEDTIPVTMGNKVAVCLCLSDCVVVMIAVCLELCTRRCEVRKRSEDG